MRGAFEADPAGQGNSPHRKLAAKYWSGLLRLHLHSSKVYPLSTHERLSLLRDDGADFPVCAYLRLFLTEASRSFDEFAHRGMDDLVFMLDRHQPEAALNAFLQVAVPLVAFNPAVVASKQADVSAFVERAVNALQHNAAPLIRHSVRTAQKSFIHYLDTTAYQTSADAQHSNATIAVASACRCKDTREGKEKKGKERKSV